MCILTGGPASGKTALARTAAALAGRPLVELTLTGGTDTSDLLGSFEQQEPARQLQVRRPTNVVCSMQRNSEEHCWRPGK